MWRFLKDTPIEIFQLKRIDLLERYNSLGDLILSCAHGSYELFLQVQFDYMHVVIVI